MMLMPTTFNYADSHVMAIVNLTPDSFYEGSRCATMEDVRERVEQAIRAGATIIDLGGYSSRPCAEDVDVEEEWRRVEMGLRAVEESELGVVVSIDTFRSEIVRRAYERYGDFIVNDISAGELDGDMVATVARLGLYYVAMHMRGTPQTMQRCTEYSEGVVPAVVAYFEQRTAELIAEGVKPERIILDPGFGFAKSVEQNYELLRGLRQLRALGYPILVGVSRKSMIYKPLGVDAERALPGTLAIEWEALATGSAILRVHDVAETVQIVKLRGIYDGVL